MSKSEPVIPKTYRDCVMIWGNQSPWTKLGLRLKHTVEFDPSEVVRDGHGNILSMPVLERKPCFGRPEAVFRHGERVKKITNRNGRIVDGTKHQCGKCPAGVHEACRDTAFERVSSDPEMNQSYLAWKHYCDAFNKGAPVCTGAASRLWGEFKQAIAKRGPFANSNDAAVVVQQLQKRDAQREKWNREKRRQRKRERERAKEARQPPSKQFVLNLKDERVRRFDALLEVLGQSGQPPSRARVPAHKQVATATITANAWFVRELIQAFGEDANPGKIARLMAKHNLCAGVAAPTLKARMEGDLKRADECERDGIWKSFDPDADLDSYEYEDDYVEDRYDDPANEIPHTLSDLELANLLLP